MAWRATLSKMTPDHCRCEKRAGFASDEAIPSYVKVGHCFVATAPRRDKECHSRSELGLRATPVPASLPTVCRGFPGKRSPPAKFGPASSLSLLAATIVTSAAARKRGVRRSDLHSRGLSLPASGIHACLCRRGAYGGSHSSCPRKRAPRTPGIRSIPRL